MSAAPHGSSPAPFPLAAPPPRVVTDPATGERASVVEVPAAAVPGAKGERCLLVAVGDRAVRRVWRYPPH